jgi:hypothetical protein
MVGATTLEWIAASSPKQSLQKLLAKTFLAMKKHTCSDESSSSSAKQIIGRFNIAEVVGVGDQARHQFVAEYDLWSVFPGTRAFTVTEKLEAGESPEAVQEWIAQHVTEKQEEAFVENVTFAVLTHGGGDSGVPTAAHTGLVKSLTGASTKAQCGCVGGVVRHCDALDYPSDLLRRLFDHLYQSEVVEEEAFTMWRDQQTGGKALVKATSFFTWLDQAEVEAEGDDAKEGGANGNDGP